MLEDSEQSRYGLADLLYLMGRLRDPRHGCPWDLQQDYQSLVPHTLEEAYEVADAVERGDFTQLRGELGDLLFQVVYYSQLAAEEQRFDFAAVVDAIVGKLVRRHPHVFAEGDLYAEPGAAVAALPVIQRRWEDIKAEERAESAGALQQPSLLDDVPKALPALGRAAKLQKRAAHGGFDWPQVPPVVSQVREELDELLRAVAENDRDGQQEELGDLLFMLVHLARHLQQDPEVALRRANEKFERRFRYMERALHEGGGSVERASLAQLERLWQQAKASERADPPGAC